MPRILHRDERGLAAAIGEIVYAAVLANREEGEEIYFRECGFYEIGLCFLRTGYLDEDCPNWVNEDRYSSMLATGHFRDFSSVEGYIEEMYEAIIEQTAEVEIHYGQYLQDISRRLLRNPARNVVNTSLVCSLLINKRTYLRRISLQSICYAEPWSFIDYPRHSDEQIDPSEPADEILVPSPATTSSINFEVSGFTLARNEPSRVRGRPELPEDPPALFRPMSHGQNDEAHNLDIKYRNCWVLAKGVVGKVITFQKDREKGAVQIRYLLGNPETSLVGVKEVMEPYDVTKHILDFPTLGWVKNDSICTYLETTPGTYLRGVSENNTHALVTISNNKVTREGNYWPDISALIPELVVRKFDNISLGLKEKYNNIIISPEACLFLGKSPKGEHEKYFLMIASMCVGEHLKNTPAIKLYKQYKPLKSFIETVINYETK